MILVRTWDTLDGGVGIELSGHAEREDAVPNEHSQVCSGASMLLVTLASMTNGQWNGQNNGSVSCTVPSSMLQYAEFVLMGIMLLDTAYAGHIQMRREDSKLGMTWEQVSAWGDQYQDEAESA